MYIYVYKYVYQARRNQSGWSGRSGRSGLDPTNFRAFGQYFWRVAPLKAKTYDLDPFF